MEVHGFREKGSSILKKNVHGFLRIHAFKKEKKGKARKKNEKPNANVQKGNHDGRTK